MSALQDGRARIVAAIEGTRDEDGRAVTLVLRSDGAVMRRITRKPRRIDGWRWQVVETLPRMSGPVMFGHEGWLWLLGRLVTDEEATVLPVSRRVLAAVGVPATWHAHGAVVRGA